VCWKLQAGLDLLDFALVQLENLCHILDSCSNFWFTADDIDVIIFGIMQFGVTVPGHTCLVLENSRMCIIIMSSFPCVDYVSDFIVQLI
jgi:hypothetical protein